MQMLPTRSNPSISIRFKAFRIKRAIKFWNFEITLSMGGHSEHFLFRFKLVYFQIGPWRKLTVTAGSDRTIPTDILTDHKGFFSRRPNLLPAADHK
jgi:hypothetical protein